jgi:hypothetical protein
MAIAIRSSLTEDLVDITPLSWIVLSLWTIAAAAVTGAILLRRP